MQLCRGLSILWHCLSLPFFFIWSPGGSESKEFPYNGGDLGLISESERPPGEGNGRSSKKQESSRKTSTSALLTMPKPLTVWITINCGKFWKRWEYRTTWPASWETYMQVRKPQLKLDMEQQTGSRLEKEYVKAVYCHPDYLTYMQSTSWETLGWKKHRLESRLPGEISITSDDTTLMAESEEELKSLLESERRKWKSWLKAQHSENEDHGIWSHHFMGNRWGNSG